METPAQRCFRIIGAVEELVSQEAASLANHDYPAVLGLQERIAPLVDFLATTGAAYTSTPAMRARLEMLQQRRWHHSDLLATEMTRVRSELQQAGATKRRVAQIAPVYGYGKSGVARPQLHAVG